MKTFLFLLLTGVTIFSAFGQNIPIDFEMSGNGASWTWTTFENGDNPTLEIIPNPFESGINTSSTVAKFTALQVGEPHAGCETLHGAGIGTFTIDSSTMIINIMVWKSVISDVGIKLVREDNWSLGEIKIANTVVNEWEQLTFDFTDHIGLTYDQLVIFPDFNARTADNIIYFDNVFGLDATITGIKELNEKNIALFPNPAQSEITIQSDGNIDEVNIYTITGERIAREQPHSKIATLNISNLTYGVYIVRTTVDGRTMVDKFIKN